ncbi:hypothetical protein GCM10010156_74180 [Planobispora rosea]|uniref:Uncharacterized protein n=1 Tax=Planobispora rosea TaxID=35762 RepID=A0A8J3WIL3_PLARO|nr:hypothetical protein [Planobispora rosea]GGT05670.1 hypothetical protein GCM10010156_74180 [Planobispora rosea]GIH88966.1 hypothetical protein Pro02_73740 [Planobispora rosea]
MRITIHGTAAEINALPFRRLRTFDGCDMGEVVLIINLDTAHLRKDPYSDAYRLCADLDTRKEAM